MLHTVPAAIGFTPDAAASEVSSNRYAAGYLRVPAGVNPSLTAPPEGRPTHFRVYGAAGPIAPEDLPLQKAARGTEVRDFEQEIRFDDGKVVNLLANASPLRDGNGGLRGAVAVGVDIKARKYVDKALRRERELLQTIIDRIPVMITVYEPDTKLLNVNHEFTRVTGWPAEDICGVSLMEEFYPDPDYRAHVQAFMSACREGWMDIQMRRRDSVLLHTTWANIRLADGAQVGIGIDIGERKRSQQQRLLLITELNHRVKNTLATVQSLAMQTMRGAIDPQEAFQRFEARLGTLSRAHDVLTKESWKGANLRSVVERTLEPFRVEQDRF